MAGQVGVSISIVDKTLAKGLDLKRTDLIKTPLSEGLLGADVMKEDWSVVFDYAGGRFLLGAN